MANFYVIERSDGTQLGIVPNESEFTPGQPLLPPTTSTEGAVLDLTMYGRGRLAWGERVNENFIHLLENFSNPTAPDNPLSGEMWFRRISTPGGGSPCSGSPDVGFGDMWFFDGCKWLLMLHESSTGDVSISGDLDIGGDINPTDGVLDINGKVTITDENAACDSPSLIIIGDDSPVLYLQNSGVLGSAAPAIVMYNPDNDPGAGGGSGTYGWTVMANRDTYVLSIERATSADTCVSALGQLLAITQTGTLFMTDGAGAPILYLNEGLGDASAGSDIRLVNDGVITAEDNLFFGIESEGDPGNTAFQFMKNSRVFPGGTVVARISDTGAISCALDDTTSVGAADIRIAGSGGALPYVDYGSVNTNIDTVRMWNNRLVNPFLMDILCANITADNDDAQITVRNTLVGGTSHLNLTNSSGIIRGQVLYFESSDTVSVRRNNAAGTASEAEMRFLPGPPVFGDFTVKMRSPSTIVSDNGSTLVTKDYLDAAVATGGFASGTRMLFHQASAPTGWVTVAGLNDRVIRVGVGGSTGGTWIVGGLTVSGTALSVAQLPPHSHSGSFASSGGAHTHTVTTGYPSSVTGNVQFAQPSTYCILSSRTTDAGGGAHSHSVTVASEGSGSTHNHGVTSDSTWRPAYTDVIIAQKS